MSEQKAFLEKVHIENYLSLRNVKLPLKPLTVLVGPNASGKSNVLGALRLFHKMMIAENLPPTELIQHLLWAGEGQHITFQLQAKVKNRPTVYDLMLKAEVEDLFVAENLLVGTTKVISTQGGTGEVWDENGKHQTTYKSNKLALKSAGDYGNKPITRILTEFLKGWKFYDFQPGRIRRGLSTSRDTRFGQSKELIESPQLDIDGSTLSAVLSAWYEKNPEDFSNVSESLAACTNIGIDHCEIDGESQLCLSEGYKQPIPLAHASDGILRLVAYYTLLNLTELPPLVAIEEPERSLHPGALMDIAYVLAQLAERTQVVITTHSSQLLDAFSSGSLSDTLGVLLLRNRPGLGTEVLNLEEIRSKRESLDGWIADFGMGSAIFDSGLLQDLMEEPVC